MNDTLNLTLKLPDGFELTGEFRAPEKGEYFITVHPSGFSIEIVQANFRTCPHFIVKKKEIFCYNYSCPVTVKDIYGRLVKLPEGFDCLGFSSQKIPTATHFITLYSSATELIDFLGNSPRIQLRKKN